MSGEKKREPRVAAGWLGANGVEHRAVVTPESDIVNLEFRGADAMGVDGWRTLAYYDASDVVSKALVQHFQQLAGQKPEPVDAQRDGVLWEEALGTRFLWVWYDREARVWCAAGEERGPPSVMPGPERATIVLRCCLHSGRLQVVRHPEIGPGGGEPGDREVLRVLLTPERHEDGDVGWTAQCLDPDVCSQGDSVQSAVCELLRAVSTVRHVVAENQAPGPGPAPPEVVGRWEAGTPVDSPVEGVEARLAREE